MTDTDLERRLRELRRADMAPGTAGQRLDAGRAWRELQALRARRTRNLRVGLTAAVALVAADAITIVVPVIRGSQSANPGQGQRTTPGTRPSGGPSPVRAYPGAIVARIPLSGVVSVVGNAREAWVIRKAGHSAATSYQLARIDLRTNKVTLRSNLGKRPAAVALGGGALWLTTASGQTPGQVERIDPFSGTAIAALHLPAGRCTGLAFAGGQLWVTCPVVGGKALEFFRIDPASGHVNWRASVASSRAGTIAVVRDGLWFGTYGEGVYGLVRQAGRTRAVKVPDRAFPVGFDYNVSSLVSGEGLVWEFTTDESVAKIDPMTGNVLRTYTYRSYDPDYGAGLNGLAVGNGSLWFIDWRNGGVLRVSIATGKPVGQIPGIGAAPCPETCVRVYSTPGAVWVPAMNQLIRIDPARMPG